MTDIVERLRLMYRANGVGLGNIGLYSEAADEVERLRAALREIELMADGVSKGIGDVAYRALKGDYRPFEG